MTVSAEKTEHYISFSVAPGGTPADDILKATYNAAPLENLYGIYHIQSLNETEASAILNVLSDVQELWAEQDSLAVFIHASPALAEKFEDYGLVMVPTENEAIEYVMMDKLSKDFDLEE